MDRPPGETVPPPPEEPDGLEKKTGWKYSITRTNIPDAGISGVPGSHHPQYGGTYFYQLLHAAGSFPASAPPRVRMLDPRVHGQKTAGQLVDRYGLACRPVRSLLVDYLAERRPSIDYVTMNDLAYQLGLLFWKDLETRHPGIDSLDLAPDVAVAWKQRIQHRTMESTAPGGERIQTQAPRLSAVDHLSTVRSFYLDIAECAADDPSRWAQWVVPCPVRPAELTHRQAARRRKACTDQRTRERLPVLPRLIAAAAKARADTAARLRAAATAAPGRDFTAVGQTMARAILKEPSPRTWAVGSGTGKRRNLTEEEEHAFRASAIIEMLRHSGGERGILRIAASLAAGLPADLATPSPASTTAT